MVVGWWELVEAGNQELRCLRRMNTEEGATVNLPLHRSNESLRLMTTGEGATAVVPHR